MDFTFNVQRVSGQVCNLEGDQEEIECHSPVKHSNATFCFYRILKAHRKMESIC